VNGAAGLAAPHLVARRLGLTSETQAPAIYPLRLFGVRTVAAAMDLLLPEQQVRRRALDAAVLIHASDTVAAALGGLRRELPRRSAAMFVLVSGLNTALALRARRRLPAGN
jgi:hypothetical protein